MNAFGRGRRAFLRGLLASVVAPASASAASEKPRDQGIGGTGAPLAAPPDAGDRGIGGTGVIGTIRRFGSIFVNDLRIAYPSDVAVTIDGRPATLADLRVGHVVAVAASGPGDKLSTREIVVGREVVGPIDSIDGKDLRILGQTVSAVGSLPKLQSGDWAAVSGLRRLDGTIVASLVESTPAGVARIVGPLVADVDGASIGGLVLSGANKALAGQRVLIEGPVSGGRFVPSSITADGTLAAFGTVGRVSIETFAARDGDRIRTGSGLSIEGQGGRLASGRTIISAKVAPDGSLQARAFKPTSTPRIPSGTQGAPAGTRPPAAQDRGGAPTPSAGGNRRSTEPMSRGASPGGDALPMPSRAGRPDGASSGLGRTGEPAVPGGGGGFGGDGRIPSGGFARPGGLGGTAPTNGLGGPGLGGGVGGPGLGGGGPGFGGRR